jgi:hypothetical protein
VTSFLKLPEGWANFFLRSKTQGESILQGIAALPSDPALPPAAHYWPAGWHLSLLSLPKANSDPRSSQAGNSSLALRHPCQAIY